MKSKMNLVVLKGDVRMVFENGIYFFPTGTHERKDLRNIIKEVQKTVEIARRKLLKLKNKSDVCEEKKKYLDQYNMGKSQIMGLTILASMQDRGWDYKFTEVK